MPKLTATQVKAIAEPGKHGDSDGLYLNFSDTGSKSWVQRISIDGRRRDIGLGGYPKVNLAQAGRRARENRNAVARPDLVITYHARLLMIRGMAVMCRRAGSQVID